MGFLRKIFKPVSKVLDKVIPNEIKPALPYLAAFAPMMLGPGIMGSGMAQRALMSGGMNIFGQLSQEGNEGDINLLSAGLGALSGAMTAPGKTGVDFSMSGPGEGPMLTEGAGSFKKFAQSGIDRFGADSAIGEIAKGGLKASKFMTDPGLSKYTIPVAQGTGDLMFAQAKRDQDEYDRMMEEEAENEYASDASRAFAIRQSMEAYGFTEQEILDAISAAGYAYGGRVGLEFGGIPAALENIEDDEMKDTAKFVSAMDDMDVPIMDIVEEFEIQFKRKPNSLEEIKEFYKDRYDYKGPADVKLKETMEESFREKAAEGGLMAGMGNVMKLFETPYGFDRDRFESMILEFKDYKEEGGDLGIYDFTIQFLDMVKKDTSKSDRAMAKEGGLMNLGGKEMDLRGGGFVPIGKKEKADDVPARLSKNEFVMTADAVRAAGGGSVNEGAKRMYETMNKLEAQV
jgi:hypothetical protein